MKSIRSLPRLAALALTTAALVATTPILPRNRAEARPTLVIMDEVHHAGDGLTWERSHTKADVAVRGTTSDLLLVLWGRKDTDAVEVDLRAELLEIGLHRARRGARGAHRAVKAVAREPADAQRGMVDRDRNFVERQTGRRAHQFEAEVKARAERQLLQRARRGRRQRRWRRHGHGQHGPA